MNRSIRFAALYFFILFLFPSVRLFAQAPPPLPPLCPRLAPGSAGGQNWFTDTLPNGLRVIYAPMPNSPTTHVRVLYHVGSRDEQSNRQGFAHMFEHMMFRGSAHVAPQEHMKLVGLVGGFSNAFTSFDETVYHDTLPASYTELALWLEADRMASFKVTEDIFKTERQVVAEEWRMRLNQPYGGMFDQLMPAIFRVSPYHWTPIGNMDHLNAAKVGELQAFFNKYYGPNNAILVIAGSFDLDKTREQVNQYFAWIPPRGAFSRKDGPESSVLSGITRDIPAEPAQDQPRRLEVKMTAPLARVILAYHMPPDNSDDLDALDLLLAVAGDGESSRIYRALVTDETPLCVDAGAIEEPLQDGGAMALDGTVLPGKKVEDVEKIMRQVIADLRDKAVPADELEKIKQQSRLALAKRFDTAEDTATVLGDEMLSRDKLDRITSARERLEAITPADLQKMANKYFQDDSVTTMIITPGTPQEAATAAATAQTAPAPAAEHPASATVAEAVPVNFPADYPAKPPLSGKLPAAIFAKGVQTEIALPGSGASSRAHEAVHVIVMEDHRMPIINWSLTLRSGSQADPAGKEGLAGMTAEMVRRGPKGKTFDQFNEDLESRAISLDVSDAGDNTVISGSCLKEQFPWALSATHDMLLNPAFDSAEFDHSKAQSLSEMQLELNKPQTLSSRALTHALYGDSPLGRLPTMASLSSVSLDDVKQFYNQIYKATDGAVLIISGDISVDGGQAAAKTLLDGSMAGSVPAPEYTLSKPAGKETIILVDAPDAKQASIVMGEPAYSIKSDEKFAGTLASQMLSNGIDSRLGQYVRAEKGYVYGVEGVFSPNRHAGAFLGNTDTRFETVADTIQAMFKVFNDMKAAPVPAPELASAKFRVAGQLLMNMETVQDQASYRVTGILNGYPIDYYDKYADRVGTVTADQIKDAMDKYVQEDHMTIVVAGPADTLKAQLEKIAPVQVISAAEATK